EPVRRRRPDLPRRESRVSGPLPAPAGHGVPGRGARPGVRRRRLGLGRKLVGQRPRLPALLGERPVSPRIHGALAAAATPLRDGGAAVDNEGFEPLAAFLAGAGLDGLLALGTTGEGILLSVSERKRVTELFVEVSAGKLLVAAHCGAQTT